MSKKKVYIVSSTHWDREWYQTFEQYRARLVRLIDELLNILENRPEYRCFHFDGQTVLIEDYLRIRPENAERLTKQIRAGRILIGPWYVMPDEFLVGGEALIRNLLRGKRVCDEYGVPACADGYVCDIFGHNSQLPQLLAGFGIDNAALFRGREGQEKDNFLWQGADGTRTIVHKLHPDYAYSSFYFVARWPFEDTGFRDGEVVSRMKRYLEEQKPFMATDCHLMIDGVDHIDPEAELPRLIRLLNDSLPEYEFLHSNFSDYTAEIRARKAELETVEGALYDLAREGVNNGLLKNVLSSQAHLKQANAYCERELALVAEPLDFFLTSSRAEPAGGFAPYGGFLEEAWDNVLKNQPHDSICGCSVTATHQDNVNRFKHAAEIIGAIEDDMLRRLGENVPADGKGKDGAFVVYNGSPLAVDGVAEVPFCIAEGRHQWNFRFFSGEGEELPYNIAAHENKALKRAEFKKLVKFPRYDCFTLAMRMRIPAYSYRVITYDILNQVRTQADGNWGYDEYHAPNRNIGSMRTALNEVDNGKLIVSVNENGTLDVTVKQTGKRYRGLMAFEDCGDAGDGWNYVKPGFDEELNSLGARAQIAFAADFPDYCRIAVTLTMPVYERLDGVRRAGRRLDMEIRSLVTVVKDSMQLDVRTEVDNPAVSHRLRVLFPTQMNTKSFETLLPFDLYRWDIAKPDTSSFKEQDTLVNPNQGAVRLTDGKEMFTILNNGLYEVAVLDRPDVPAYLTLFRSFANEVSENGADMGRMLFPMSFDYAMRFEYEPASETVKRAQAFRMGLRSAEAGKPGGKLPPAGRAVENDGNAVLSALRVLEDGQYEARIFDVDGGACGRLRFPCGVERAVRVRLDGGEPEEVALVDGGVEYRLGNREIATYRFRQK